MRTYALLVPLLVPSLLAQEPPAFVPNRGQWPDPVHAMVQHGTMSTWLTTTGFTTQVKVATTMPDPRGGEGPHTPPPAANAAVVAVEFVGGGSSAIEFGERLPGTANFFLGNDRAKWASGVPRHARCSLPDAWPGIHIDFSGRDGAVAYDLRVAPGVPASRAAFRVQGGESVRIGDDGALEIDVGFGTVRHGRPLAWQSRPDGTRQELPAQFALHERVVSFVVEGRDPALPLVIDPQLLWRSLLGGNDQDGIGYRQSLHRAADGRLAVCGYTNSANFPGGPSLPFGNWDGFVAIYAANGALQWSSVIGGSVLGEEWLRACRWNGNSVFFGGFSSAANYPTTPGAYQTVMQGPFGPGQFGDMVIGRLDPAAAGPGMVLGWSTFLGGTGNETLNGLAVLPGNRVAVTGWSNSLTLSTHLGAAQPTPLGPYNGYYAIFDPSLVAAAQRTQATWWGGSGTDDTPGCLVVDAAGRLVTGGWTNSSNLATTANAIQPGYQGGSHDGYVVAFDPTLSTAVYCSYLGGPGYDQANDVAIDPSGRWVVANWTGAGFSPSISFPACTYQATPPGSENGYALLLDPTLPPAQQIVWGTYVGGNLRDGVNGVAVDSAGRITVTGAVETLVGAMTTTFPRSAWCLQPVPPGGPGGTAGHWDAFVVRFDPRRCGADQLVYATFLGGAGYDYGYDVVLDERARVIVAGLTSSPSFFGQPRPGGAYDIFLTKLDLHASLTDRLGVPTPACSSMFLDAYHLATPTGMDLTLTCSSAPANSFGFLMIGLQDAPGTAIPALGLTTHLQLGGPLDVLAVLATDPTGHGSHRFLTNYTPPANLAVQALWFNGCAPLVVSDALGL